MENHSLVARKTICYFRCCCLFMISFCDLLYSDIRDCALLRSAQLCAGSNLMSPTVVLELKRHQLVQARGVVYLAKYFNCESESLSDVQLFVTHGLYSPWNSPGQNTGVGSLSLLQGIFPTQAVNQGLPIQVSCIAGGFFTS